MNVFSFQNFSRKETPIWTWPKPRIVSLSSVTSAIVFGNKFSIRTWMEFSSRIGKNNNTFKTSAEKPRPVFQSLISSRSTPFKLSCFLCSKITSSFLNMALCMSGLFGHLSCSYAHFTTNLYFFNFSIIIVKSDSSHRLLPQQTGCRAWWSQ